jgi:hypothetical protein
LSRAKEGVHKVPKSVSVSTDFLNYLSETGRSITEWFDEMWELEKNGRETGRLEIKLNNINEKINNLNADRVDIEKRLLVASKRQSTLDTVPKMDFLEKIIKDMEKFNKNIEDDWHRWMIPRYLEEAKKFDLNEERLRSEIEKSLSEYRAKHDTGGK